MRKICSQISNKLTSPDITSVKYSSNGKILKSNVYVSDSFNIDQERKVREIDFPQVEYLYKRYSMIVDTKSIFDIGPDYGVERLWSPAYHDTNWYNSSFELSSNGNFTPISNSVDNNFINNSVSVLKEIYLADYSLPFQFDLSLSNYPDQYNVNILFEEGYNVNINGTYINCNRADVSQWLPIPPPKLSMFLSSNSLDLRPEETKNIILSINNNANLNTKIILSDLSPSDNLNVKFFPNPIFISPFSNATSIVKITSPHYKNSDTIPVRIKSEIEFPQNITIIGTNTTIRDISDVKINLVREFTVNLFPPYGLDEYLASFVDKYITPLNSVWTFLVGVGAVLSPKIIQFILKITHNKTEDGHYKVDSNRKINQGSPIK